MEEFTLEELNAANERGGDEEEFTLDELNEPGAARGNAGADGGGAGGTGDGLQFVTLPADGGRESGGRGVNVSPSRWRQLQLTAETGSEAFSGERGAAMSLVADVAPFAGRKLVDEERGKIGRMKRFADGNPDLPAMNPAYERMMRSSPSMAGGMAGARLHLPKDEDERWRWEAEGLGVGRDEAREHDDPADLQRVAPPLGDEQGDRAPSPRARLHGGGHAVSPGFVLCRACTQ